MLFDKKLADRTQNMGNVYEPYDKDTIHTTRTCHFRKHSYYLFPESLTGEGNHCIPSTTS